MIVRAALYAAAAAIPPIVSVGNLDAIACVSVKQSFRKLKANSAANVATQDINSALCGEVSSMCGASGIMPPTTDAIAIVSALLMAALARGYSSPNLKRDMKSCQAIGLLSSPASMEAHSLAVTPYSAMMLATSARS
jgi:hypothetical protein